MLGDIVDIFLEIVNQVLYGTIGGKQEIALLAGQAGVLTGITWSLIVFIFYIKGNRRYNIQYNILFSPV